MILIPQYESVYYPEGLAIVATSATTSYIEAVGKTEPERENFHWWQ
jgi:hypothetical protein